MLVVFLALPCAAALREWKAGDWRWGTADAVYAALCVLGVFLLGVNLRAAYVLLAVSSSAAGAAYMARLGAAADFYPLGFLWLAAMGVALICWIKVLQNMGRGGP